jgi:hypothetical protein
MKEYCIESGMTFQFEQGTYYLPEKTEPYVTLVSGNGIKSCDIIFYRSEDKLFLIEAKTSSPNPLNPDSTDHVTEYVRDIHFKWIHSLLLILGLIDRRNYAITSTVPDWLLSLPMADCKIGLVLIIKNHPKAWLSDILDVFQKELHGTKKAFKLEDPIVINEEIARNLGWVK